MPSTISEVNKLFTDGVDAVTLTRAEWDAIQEIVKQYSATGLEMNRAQRETERVKRISRPVWRALSVSAVSGFVRVQKVQDWEMRLRHSMDVGWQDLPQNHPKRMDWRR